MRTGYGLLERGRACKGSVPRAALGSMPDRRQDLLNGVAVFLCALQCLSVSPAEGSQAVASATNSCCTATFAAGPGYEWGQAKYEIGSFDAGGAPISQLTWPLGNALVLGEACVACARLEGTLGLGRSLKEDAGTIDDVDYEEFPHVESIRSESRADLTTWLADARILYWFPASSADAAWLVGAGAGYAFRSMQWEASDLHQWTPATPDDPDIHSAGLVATYEARVHMPCLALAARRRQASWSLEGWLGYAPHVLVDDEGTHTLRGIAYDAHMQGRGLQWEARGAVRVTDRWFLAAAFSGFSIQACGDERNRDAGIHSPDMTWSEDKRFKMSEMRAQLGVLCSLP